MQRSAFRQDRRTFIKTAAIAGGLALQHALGAPFSWAGRQPTAEPTAPYGENAEAGGVFDQAEALTVRYLDDIEQRLQIRLKEKDQPFTDELRMWLIRLAMQPLVAGAVSNSLEMIGDSKNARERLSFIMPLVRWMSEPFLFPLETEGTPEEQKREIDKVFGLMARLRTQGLSTSLDNVGDASLSSADAQAYQQYYLALVRAFIDSSKADQLNMSLKLSALVYDMDAALGDGAEAESKRREIVEAFSKLLETAAQAPDRSIFLRIDMEEYAYKDLTLRLFREIVESNPSTAFDASGKLRLGVVIQAYLRDSARDVQMLADWARKNKLRAPIRLVKGAYLDFERDAAADLGYPSPVWDHKPSTDANYEAVSAYMLLNLDAVDPAFATHNIRTQAHAMALAEAYGLSPNDAPIQMLYGMGDSIKHVIASMHRPMRAYIPAGSLARGLKYAGRRFAELASSDNALARTMRGDFSGVNTSAPVFTGKQDQADSEDVRAILEQALANKGESSHF
ncbi:MAG: proline dehydrogenase [Desulfovibrionales bacterium]|nr:proline dehydrogenase [Desulfovibrionales bacterium]